MNRLRAPLVRGYMLWAYRRAALRKPVEAFRYLVAGRELTNFTYEIANVAELVEVLVVALAEPREQIEKWLEEVTCNDDFLTNLTVRLQTRRDRAQKPLFGRRLGWYCALRSAQPALSVETGSHDGLGTALLLYALERNAKEGGDGTLLSVDIDADSGWLVPTELTTRLERHIGDARELLTPSLAGRPVGVFIHDSLHTYEHERFELELAAQHADQRLILISDNAHSSTALADVCRERGLRYYEFRERPIDHFYPGATMGIGVWG
jgi:hypothetical protein